MTHPHKKNKNKNKTGNNNSVNNSTIKSSSKMLSENNPPLEIQNELFQEGEVPEAINLEINKMEAPASSQIEKFFLSEVLLTAGPRKNFTQFASEGDIDLGEDVAGVVTFKNRTIFWVLDGTSDSAIVKIDNKEAFSSRLLAQEIAMYIQAACKQNIKMDSSSLIKEATEKVKEKWIAFFSDLSEDKRQDIASKFKTNTIDISTTILVGILNLNGDLCISRIGDSKILCFDKNNDFIASKISEKPAKENYTRQFARLIFHSHKLDISFSENYDKIETDLIKDVSNVFSCSDGTNALTENYIKLNFKKMEYDKIRAQIPKIPQKTNDDKTFLTIQIKNE